LGAGGLVLGEAGGGEPGGGEFVSWKVRWWTGLVVDGLWWELAGERVWWWAVLVVAAPVVVLAGVMKVAVVIVRWCRSGSWERGWCGRTRGGC
jgi:hypothetical protein